MTTPEDIVRRRQAAEAARAADAEAWQYAAGIRTETEALVKLIARWRERMPELGYPEGQIISVPVRSKGWLGGTKWSSVEMACWKIAERTTILPRDDSHTRLSTFVNADGEFIYETGFFKVREAQSLAELVSGWGYPIPVAELTTLRTGLGNLLARLDQGP